MTAFCIAHVVIPEKKQSVYLSIIGSYCGVLQHLQAEQWIKPVMVLKTGIDVVAVIRQAEK